MLNFIEIPPKSSLEETSYNRFDCCHQGIEKLHQLKHNFARAVVSTTPLIFQKNRENRLQAVRIFFIKVNMKIFDNHGEVSIGFQNNELFFKIVFFFLNPLQVTGWFFNLKTRKFLNPGPMFMCLIRNCEYNFSFQ